MTTINPHAWSHAVRTEYEGIPLWAFIADDDKLVSRIRAILTAYLSYPSPAPAESGAVAITDDLVDAIHFVYQMKVREYDADFRNDMLPEGAWEEKYGTNLHATSLGEKWALKQAMIAVNTIAYPAPSASMGRVREALLAARDLAKTMEGLTGCRSDDDYVWGAQAKIEAAIASLPTQESEDGR